MIVSGAGGYVTGTYLSTTAITGIVAAAGGTLLGLGGTALAAFSGLASSVIGSAGVAGTTIGATGLTGELMSVGILSSTPIVIPVATAGGLIVASVSLAYVWRGFRNKLDSANGGQEAQFTEVEAKIMERLIKRLPPPKG